MKNIIEINHLSKSFGEVNAVQDLSFRVKEGEFNRFLIFGIIQRISGQKRRKGPPFNYECLLRTTENASSAISIVSLMSASVRAAFIKWLW